MVIVCDCHYRSAITAIRLFHRENEKVIAVTTDVFPHPPAFSSRYVEERCILPSDKKKYKEALIELCKKQDMPILFPIGNFTLNIISENLDAFQEISRFCVSPPEMLACVNNKSWVKAKGLEHNIFVPKQYSINENINYPVVVKPFCGEKFNLKASERYKIAHNADELNSAYKYFQKFDSFPIIEEYIDGYGAGVCVLLDSSSRARTVFCHKRLVEYPISGGPSACLETFRDDNLILKTCNFFSSLGFVGMAMAEYKITDHGSYLLEINPRIWGSFPATAPAKSDYIKSYIMACNRTSVTFGGVYIPRKKVKFLRGSLAAFVECIKSKNFVFALKILGLMLNPTVSCALFSLKDPLPAIRDLFRR